MGPLEVIVLQAALAFGAFFGILFLGGAMLVAIQPKQRRWRGYAPLDKNAQGAARSFPPAFEPLHMEPFTLQWPSEVERPSTEIQELPWPSETWDDPYFGARARDDVQRIAKTAAAIDAKRARSAQEANRLRHQADQEAASRNAAIHKAQPQQAQSHHKAKRSKHQQPAAQAQPQPKRPQPKQQPQQPTPSGSGSPPSAAEIGELVKKLGLGGAVEEIRKRTGWDFRRSAQYLADTLRNK